MASPDFRPPSGRAENYVFVVNSAEVFALNVVLELHHHLPEHGEGSRLNDRRKRRVRSVGTVEFLGEAGLMSPDAAIIPKKNKQIAVTRLINTGILYSTIDCSK